MLRKPISRYDDPGAIALDLGRLHFIVRTYTPSGDEHNDPSRRHRLFDTEPHRVDAVRLRLDTYSVAAL